MKTKSAHWIQKTHLFRKDEYECSACCCRADKPNKTCPHCTLPMKGSKYDPSWVDEMDAMDAIFDD
mgnify:FL=1